MIRKQFPALLTLGCLALIALVFVPNLASSEEAKPAAKPDKAKVVPPPPVDSDEDVEAALAEFKVNFKAKGLRGDERSAQRDWALEQLSAYQHKKVIDTMAKKMRHSDEYVRLSAVVHLANQRALPAYAGKKVAEMGKKMRKDIFFVISAFDTIGKLKYLGAMDLLESGLRHQDFGVKKAAIASIGNIGEYRLMYAMLKEVGIDAERVAEGPPPSTTNAGGSEAEVVSEGYSWEGADVTVDTGTAGDGDQKAAEKAAKEQAAANKAAAEKAAGVTGGAKGPTGGGAGGGTNPGAGGGTSSGGGRGASGRSKQELIYPIKITLAKLTGEDFQDAKSIFAWLRANNQYMKTKVKEVSAAEKSQKEADKKK